MWYCWLTQVLMKKIELRKRAMLSPLYAGWSGKYIECVSDRKLSWEIHKMASTISLVICEICIVALQCGQGSELETYYH